MDGSSFLSPSSPAGIEITPANFKQSIVDFAEAFSNQNLGLGLAEAFLKVSNREYSDEQMKAFDEELKREWPESTLHNPDIVATGIEEKIASRMSDLHLSKRMQALPEEARQLELQKFQEHLEKSGDLWKAKIA